VRARVKATFASCLILVEVGALGLKYEGSQELSLSLYYVTNLLVMIKILLY